MATENLKERKVYRIMSDLTNKIWDKIAFWTTANSVDAADGKSLETKVGAINGITDSLTSTSSSVAASAKAVSTLNSNLPYLSNFTYAETITNASYTATDNCLVYVSTVTNDTQYQSIITKIGNIYVRYYQNTVAKSDLEDGFLVALKSGDVLSVTGAKSYKFYVYK